MIYTITFGVYLGDKWYNTKTNTVEHVIECDKDSIETTVKRYSSKEFYLTFRRSIVK